MSTSHSHPSLIASDNAKIVAPKGGSIYITAFLKNADHTITIDGVNLALNGVGPIDLSASPLRCDAIEPDAPGANQLTFISGRL